LHELATIDLTSNEIDNLIDGTFTNLNKLECVYLRHNKLKRFPIFKGCDNLKELHVGNNKLTDLSAEDISTILSVRQLDLRDNKIPSLPEEISNMQLLERLDVTNNELSDLPASLGVLPNLKSLLVEGNALRTIRRDIIQRGTVGLLKYLRARLTEADLSRLRESGAANVSPTPARSSPPIPDKYAMKAAKALNLSKKELKCLPARALEDAKEAAVTAVDMSKNYFASVPDELKTLMPQLQELNFSANQIVEIPSWLGTLGSGNLLYLNLCNNRLSSLPSELAQLAHLREIALSYNKLASIPPCLFGCAKLETLILNGNQIGTIDVDGLSRLTALAVLDLQNNSIDRVPPELGLMTQLRSLQLEGNTFRSPRSQVLLQGTESVLAYLRDRIPK
jgi:Leucine-rich repeat (LRR) protein